jgi:hypothetical protein
MHSKFIEGFAPTPQRDGGRKLLRISGAYGTTMHAFKCSVSHRIASKIVHNAQMFGSQYFQVIFWLDSFRTHYQTVQYFAKVPRHGRRTLCLLTPIESVYETGRNSITKNVVNSTADAPDILRFSLTLQPQFGPWPTSMKLSVSL